MVSDRYHGSVGCRLMTSLGEAQACEAPHRLISRAPILTAGLTGRRATFETARGLVKKLRSEAGAHLGASRQVRLAPLVVVADLGEQ